VLDRYTLDTTGATPGVYGMTLNNVGFGRDTAADANYPGYRQRQRRACNPVTPPPQYGLVAVDVACPGLAQDADVEIAGQTVQAADCISPPPTEISAGVGTVLCLRKSIVNNGPTTPVDGSITTGLTGPATAPSHPMAATPPFTDEHAGHRGREVHRQLLAAEHPRLHLQ
jgi:hypothetical protein